MKHIDFLITNPNHHVLITLPVASELKKRGISVRYISLCEVRKFKTPQKLFKDMKIDFHYFSIDIPKSKTNKEQKKITIVNRIKSRILRDVFWIVVLRRKLKKWFKGTTHVVMLNDAAYPNNYLIRMLSRQNIETILMQEGIRFPLPVEKDLRYGNSGIDHIIAWGRKSADYFQKIAKPNTKIVSLGSPGFDKSLYIQQPLASIPEKIRKVAIFGNPIDDQKFVTPQEKIALYIDLARLLVDFSERENRNLEIIFKNHPRESPEMLREILELNGMGHIRVYESSSDIDISINTIDAGIVFASTVGINVIIHGKKLAVVKLKDYDYLGDYVQDGVAYGLDVYSNQIYDQLDAFLSGEHYCFRNYRNYLDDFASNSGKSNFAIADYIQNL